MTSLLPDESYCTTELGRLLFQPKSEWSGRGYVVDAKETAQLGVKFIEYTLLIVMTPKQSLGLDSRSFVVSTRYRTLNKLHAQLKKLHAQLYLRNIFPTFPEPKWLGGNDVATVAERKGATEQFLSYLLDQEVLRKSRLLHQFLETAVEKVPDGEILESHLIVTSGRSLLDMAHSVPSDVSPTISPETSGSEFLIEDVTIEAMGTEGDPSGGGGRSFLKDYLTRLRGSSDDGSDTYVVSAGRLVAAAQVAESEGSFQSAFHSYKDAASVLIKGSSNEKCTTTRNALRLKAAKYLERAERIYRNHLRYDNAPLFDVPSVVKPVEDEVAFRSSNDALKRFRFLGVLPDVEATKRVFLVEEIGLNVQYVMKLVERRDECGEERVFLPVNVPHMVPLLKYFTTQGFVILLLEYVKTGRLWSFLCRYLAEAEKKFDRLEREEMNEDFVEQPRPITAAEENPYKGRHTRFSVSADCERLATLQHEALQDAEGDGVSASAVVCSVGEDAAAEGEGEGAEPAQYILIPADTADAQAQEMQVEEEAPAALSLSCTSCTATSASPSTTAAALDTQPSTSSTQSKMDDRLLPLPQAMSRCRTQLRESKRCWSGVLPESLIVHWSAQCVSMLYVLHSQGALIGDLHPDNLLIDEEANLIFTYQARWQNEGGIRDFLSGYAAPECHLPNAEVTAACDVWSLGAILFELLLGRPLCAAAPHGVGRLSELPLLSSHDVSFAARDLLTRMLQVDPEERPTIDQIRNHPVYASINWQLYDNPHMSVRHSLTHLTLGTPEKSALDEATFPIPHAAHNDNTPPATPVECNNN